MNSFYLKRRLSTLPLLRSTIDVVGLNFSVRNGKRWIPNAITTLIPFKMFDSGQRYSFSNLRFVSISTNTADISILPSGNRKSRAISTTRLRHYCPYTCSLSTSQSTTTLEGDLILRLASYLDAFSTYPIQTQIPGGAPGGTTGKPEVCPTRSSRTSVRATQISCAHDRQRPNCLTTF